MFVTENTVQTHVRHIFQKLGVRSSDSSWPAALVSPTRSSADVSLAVLCGTRSALSPTRSAGFWSEHIRAEISMIGGIPRPHAELASFR